MTTQFLHLETYSRAPNKRGQSVKFVLAEAGRAAWASTHVRRPQPPTLLYGLSPADVQREHDRRVEDARLETATGPRRLRTNQHTLLTVVVSYPATGKPDRWPQAVSHWLDDTVAWLGAQFGRALTSVVLHTDEGQPHVHAFALSTDPQMKARSLHPGARAKDEICREGAANWEGDIAYRRAMRAWQDDFWSVVSSNYGHARSGPKRERLTRAEWKARQEEAAKIQRMKADIEREKRQMLDHLDVVLQDAQNDLERRYRWQIKQLTRRGQDEAKRADEAERRLAAVLPVTEEQQQFPSPEKGSHSP